VASKLTLLLFEGIFKKDIQARAWLLQAESARPREAYSI